MLGLGALSFVTPMALWALAALPVIWWLLRFTPPKPEAVRFPPFRLLLDLVTREDQPDKTPWWLVALRLALAALVILAVARPLLSEDSGAGLGGERLLVVVDDGWAAAPDWPLRQRAMNEIFDAAGRAGAPVALAVTTPEARPRALDFRPASEVRERAAALIPKALGTDRVNRLNDIAAAIDDTAGLQVVWLADGLDAGTGEAFATGLGALAGGRTAVRVFNPAAASIPVAISAPRLEDGNLRVPVRRADSSAAEAIVLHVRALNGRSLAEQSVLFEPGSDQAEGLVQLPVELRNEAARIEVGDENSAGSVFLFDDRWRRKTVGLVSGASFELEQPLLSPLYYVSRALEPTAELREPQGAGGIGELIRNGLSMLVLADVGIVPREDRDAITGWVEDGGVLVRFAGPRLAGGNDDLVPVQLREGDRALGSALSWEEPQGLAQFPDAGPFAGLATDDSIRVARQVLAEPTPDLQDRVWASLADGTPLVTAARRGNGLVVLVHVTANADWSNLPLSGLFVEMLNRVVELAPGSGAVDGAGSAQRAGDMFEAWAPRQALNGYGELGPAPVEAQPIPAAEMDRARPDAVHPAGLYHRSGATRALNLLTADAALTPIGALPAGIAVSGYVSSSVFDLSGPLFAAAGLLFLLDCLAALFLSGAFYRLRFRGAATVLAAGLLALPSQDLRAQEQPSAVNDFALQASLETRLAYVVTGDRQVDDVTYAGLLGLNAVLQQRTSVEPAEPMAIDIERDDIVFFPIIYWPILPDSEVPSAQALAKIDAFMKSGGTIFFDTRDYQTGFSGGGEVGPATMALRAILENLDVPALEPVPPEHVITKAFYLLQSFPGRYAGGKLWVEAAHAADEVRRDDGVSSIIIGSNDYAAGWAIGADGQPLFAAVPEGERQREFAYRTGINIVMYALTGNYKADQVHVPALLERLGQ